MNEITTTLPAIKAGDRAAAFRLLHLVYDVAAEAVRRSLVEHARRRQNQKRGGEMQRVDLD